MTLKISGLGAAAVALAAVSVVGVRPAMAQLRAFGEAEGYGAIATGGRAATGVYHVTNLNDSGVGSLRDAVSGSNRIVVFDVAGEIKLTSGGIGAQSNLTIAGQTAPGEGITITGAQAIGFTNRTNVIARYLRMRPGSQSPGSDNGMSMTDTGTAILDHVSIEFGKYNNIDAVSGNLPHITIQNSIIADPIDNGTSNRGQGFGAHLEAVNGFYTISNNLWANSHSRNPLAKVNDQFKNNIDYNTEIGYLTSGTSTPFKHDVVNNAFIFGPASSSSGDFGQLSTPDKFYQSGNVQDTDKKNGFNPTATAPLSDTDTRRSLTPLHASTLSLPTLSVDDAVAYVTAHAGASLVRDDLDDLVVSQVQTFGFGTAGTGAGTAGPKVTPVPLDVENPDAGHTGMYHKSSDTGLPNNGLGVTSTAGSRVVYEKDMNGKDTTVIKEITGDNDRDGILDTWEAAHGMSSATGTGAADAMLLNPLGYKMVEQYFNELGDTNASRAYAGGTVSAAMDTGLVRGTGTANGLATLSSGTANLMKLSIGGNGPAAGETLTVNGTGNLSVYDTVVVGDQNNATLNVAGGTVSAWNVVLGNTVYSPTAVNNVGTINFSGGTLNISALVQGAGTPGNWNAGGSMNWTGGTLLAAGTLNVSAPIAVGTGGGTINTNGLDGTVSSVVSDLPGSVGGLLKQGAGTMTLTGNSTFTGALTIQTGVVAVTSLTNSGVAGPLGAGTDAGDLVFNGGTLRANGAATLTTNRLFTLTRFAGTLDGGANGIQFTGTGDVAFTGNGNRTLFLTGTSSNSAFYCGLGDGPGGVTGVTLNATTTAGRWLFNSSAAPRTYSGDTTILQGTLLTLANNVLPYGAGRGDLVVTSGTFELNNTNQAINGLEGAGFVNQRGTSLRTLTLGNGDGSNAFTGALTNSGTGGLSVVKVGSGTQIFSGANTYFGVTVVQGGVLQTGGAATTNVMTNAGGMDVQNGKWLIDYTGGPTPAATIRSLLAGGRAGNFTTGRIKSTTATASRGLGYADRGTGVTVMATLYGDADLDGGVSINDFNALTTNFGQSTGKVWVDGDFDYDGGVSINDFNLLAGNFGESLNAPAARVDYAGLLAFAAQHDDLVAFEAVTGVPEPTTLGLLAAAATLGLRRRHAEPRA